MARIASFSPPPPEKEADFGEITLLCLSIFFPACPTIWRALPASLPGNQLLSLQSWIQNQTSLRTLCCLHTSRQQNMSLDPTTFSLPAITGLATPCHNCLTSPLSPYPTIHTLPPAGEQWPSSPSRSRQCGPQPSTPPLRNTWIPSTPSPLSGLQSTTLLQGNLLPFLVPPRCLCS